MEVGDQFIHYGRGKIVKGKIARTFTKVKYDFVNGVKVLHRYIVSEEGEEFDQITCLKIESEIGLSFLRKILKIIKKI
jgi:hypothetical protein